MAFLSFGSLLIAEDLLEDQLGVLSRAWERDSKGGIHPIFLRRFAPQFSVPPVLEALQRSIGSLELPPVCGTGHQFGTLPKPHWKLHHRQGRSLRRLQEKCRDESFPFGLSQALNVAWNLAHACARFWRRGLSVGAINPDSVRIDFEGGLFLPDLGWMPTLIGVADADPAIRAALPELPRGPGDGGLEEEARRFGALLYELITFAPLPVGVPVGEAIAKASIWTPEGPEPLPEPVREGLARLLGEDNPFETLEGALKGLEGLAFDEEEGPSTFNLAHLMHTLFRQEYDRQREQLAEELEALQASELWGADRPQAAEQPSIPIRRKSSRGLLLAGALLVAGIGAGALLLMRDNERSRRNLQDELVRLQTAYAEQVQLGADAASIENHQNQLKDELKKLAETARTAEERTLVGKEIERLQVKAPVPVAGTRVAIAATLSTLGGESPAAELRYLPMPQRSEAPAAQPQVPAPATRVAAPQPAPVLAPAAASMDPDRTPQVISQQRILLPAGAARTAVSLRIFIHEDGHPLRATPVPGSSATPEVIQAAVEAAMRSRYAPALRGGKPTRDWVEVQFTP